MSLMPIMRPKLPSADRLAPYLRSIDSSRVYSNFGPLALSLEDRLAEHYGLNQGTVATVANATLGLYSVDQFRENLRAFYRGEYTFP